MRRPHRGINRTKFLSRLLKHRGTEGTEAAVARLLRDLRASVFFSLRHAPSLSARGHPNPFFIHFTQVPQRFIEGLLERLSLARKQRGRTETGTKRKVGKVLQLGQVKGLG